MKVTMKKLTFVWDKWLMSSLLFDLRIIKLSLQSFFTFNKSRSFKSLRMWEGGTEICKHFPWVQMIEKKDESKLFVELIELIIMLRIFTR